MNDGRIECAEVEGLARIRGADPRADCDGLSNGHGLRKDEVAEIEVEARPGDSCGGNDIGHGGTLDPAATGVLSRLRSWPAWLRE